MSVTPENFKITIEVYPSLTTGQFHYTTRLLHGSRPTDETWAMGHGDLHEALADARSAVTDLLVDRL